MQLGHRSLLLGAVAPSCCWPAAISPPWGSSSSGSDYGATSLPALPAAAPARQHGRRRHGPAGGVGGEERHPGHRRYGGGDIGARRSWSLSARARPSALPLPRATGSRSRALASRAAWERCLRDGAARRTFTVRLVSTGSGCVLNLTYAPTATRQRHGHLNYVFVDNAGLSKVPGRLRDDPLSGHCRKITSSPRHRRPGRSTPLSARHAIGQRHFHDR